MGINNILKRNKLIKEDLKYLMGLTNSVDLNKLYQSAYKLRCAKLGRKVYFRGIIEFSNKCIKNCHYCGIRRDNSAVKRFTMSKEEILESIDWIYKNNYASIVLQSGERDDKKYIGFVNDLIKEIKKISNGQLGITLSLGEQDKETYQRWFDLGAHRYLLRIETSNSNLYQEIHPKDHSFQRRLECLKDLKEIGYQVGTGVMIGLPGQTIDDLVDDLLFFKDRDIDMIGMGPYVIHEDTPIINKIEDKEGLKERNLELGLKMIAILRLLMPDINIAATTALEALNPLGRKLALQAGANILMPVITHPDYRSDYQLYQNKPSVDMDAVQSENYLLKQLEELGEEIGYGEWGDSPHYFKRFKDNNEKVRGDIDAKYTTS